MTGTGSRSPRGSTRPGTGAARSGAGALVRLPLTPGPWAESLPPVPEGHVVTVSFSSSAATVEHEEALVLLGYRVVAGPEEPGDERAWMLVSSALAGEHPAWWQALRTGCDRVYALKMGPVLRALEPLLRAHFTA